MQTFIIYAKSKDNDTHVDYDQKFQVGAETYKDASALGRKICREMQIKYVTCKLKTNHS
jgi:hypothetical protein